MPQLKEKPSSEDLEFYGQRCVGKYFLVYLFMNEAERRYAEWFDLTPLYFDVRSPFHARMYEGLTESALMAALIVGELSTTHLGGGLECQN